MLKLDNETPDSYLDEVDVKYSTEKEKTNVLADVYTNSRPESSWQHIVETLYDEGQLAAAKKAKSFLQQNGEWCLHLCDVIMCIVSIVMW